MGLRLRLLALMVAAAPAVGAPNAQATTEIKVSERRTLAGDEITRRDPALPAATHRLTLTLVHFVGSRWSRDAMVRAAGRAAEILGQCGLALWRVEIVRVDAPRRYHDLDTPVSRALARELRLPAPTVYFVTDTRHDPAFDAEAIGRANSAARPELADSVWITRAARDIGIALAHELVHVLTDSGAHSERPDSLMREETAPAHTRLTGAACARLRDVGTKNGLLHSIDSRHR